jgi:hypothetical protein
VTRPGSYRVMVVKDLLSGPTWAGPELQSLETPRFLTAVPTFTTRMYADQGHCPGHKLPPRHLLANHSGTLHNEREERNFSIFARAYGSSSSQAAFHSPMAWSVLALAPATSSPTAAGTCASIEDCRAARSIAVQEGKQSN